ncbi:MAG: hypothetical protein QG657_3747 [Acidobacteriota bacterium]|nr:hypothetical protein [Acidobacteriota bacterium]
MDDKEFNDYLEKRYQTAVEWYDNKAIKNKKAYTILQWGVICFSAITPVLVAIGGELTLRVITVIISFFVAAGTTILKTFKYQENWINYRTTCETLRKEIHYYKARANEYKTNDDPERIFVKRVEALISRENTLWLIEQKKEDTDAEKSNLQKP